MTVSTPTPRHLDPQFVRGAAELEPTACGTLVHRLPRWAREQFPDAQVLAMESQPSGVRLVFSTSARVLELETHASRVAYRGTDRPRGRVDVRVDGVLHTRDVLTGGDVTEVDLTTGGASRRQGRSHTTTARDLPEGTKRVEVWLPHNESVEIVALRADAALEAVDGSGAARWVHHGSSISQGSNAVAPSEIWPAVAARLAGVELHNLGLGGAALVDPFVARVVRDLPADLITLKLGINVVNLDAMRRRSFVPAVHGFLDTIRDGHPETPIVLVSPIHCGIHEDTPGPGAVDPATLGTDAVRFVATGDPADVARGALTLRVIRDALEEVVATRSDDAHLRLLHGTELYGPEDAEALPLPDGLHPGPDAHQLIGERFASLALTSPHAR